MAETILGNAIDFFKTLGVYDVLLPFLLVFTVMFAILERTKVLGVESNGITKKNLNAMVAFVTAFFVVASSKLVETITRVSSEIIILMMLLVFFLMLVGTFYKKSDIDKEGVFLEKEWKTGFMAFVAICIVFIFLNALTNETGDTWLEVFWDWLSRFYTDTTVAALLLVIFMIAVMYFISRSEETK